MMDNNDVTATVCVSFAKSNVSNSLFFFISIFFCWAPHIVMTFVSAIVANKKNDGSK